MPIHVIRNKCAMTLHQALRNAHAEINASTVGI
jgi:hypothetical protein